MNVRNRLGALLAAGALVMAVSAVAMAAPPTYSIEVSKSASPTAVPPSGGSVTFTISVTNTGSGFFNTVNVVDSLAGCSVAGPFGDQASGAGAGRLDEDETWTYTCTVAGVTPGTTNEVTVNACHDTGACGGADHDATDTASVTLGTGDATQAPASDPPASDPPASDPPASDPPASDPPASDPPASDPPASDPPASDPPASDAPGGSPQFSGDEGGIGDDVDPTEPSTDAAGVGSAAKPADTTWMLVISLGLLMASVIVMSPSRTARER